MRRNLAIGAIALLAACATSQAQPQLSWGKPGVTLTDYWNDAAQCALVGATADRNGPTSDADLTRYGADRSNPTGAANTSMRPANQPSGIEATTDLNGMLTAARQSQALRERQARQAREAAAEGCLRDRGYRQFQLTAEQAARLATLNEGSPERRTYLHSLASDPAVLAGQGVSVR
jgi:hypothetical protein